MQSSLFPLQKEVQLLAELTGSKLNATIDEFTTHVITGTGKAVMFSSEMHITIHI